MREGLMSGPDRRGMALVVVLMILSILGLLFGVAGNHQGLSVSVGSGTADREGAYFVSYGALQRALTELRRDPDWPGVASAPFPGRKGHTYDLGIFRNTTQTPMSTPAGVDIPPDTTLVLSTGYFGNTTRQTAGILGTSSGVSSGFAALTQDKLYIKGGRVSAFTTTGGFSQNDMQAVPNAAQLGSVNGTVFIESRQADSDNPLLPARIDGTIASDKVDGDLSTQEAAYSIDAHSTFGGETQLTDPAALDPPEAPAYLGGPAFGKSSGSFTLTPGHYQNFFASGDAVVTLEPGDYFFKDVFFTNDTAKVLTSGPVRIFVDKEFFSGETSAVNFEGDPRNCEIHITGSGELGYIAHESHVWARIRALRGKYHVSGDLYGDIQSKELDLIGDFNGSGGLHFFTDLGTSSGPAVDGDLVYTSQWVVK